MIKLLIESYREKSQTKTFNKLLRKQIWQKISENLQERGYVVTGSQCTNKWKGLMKQYKKQKSSINKTGSVPRFWKYFDSINEFMENNLSISPTALSSNLKGYVVHQSKKKQLFMFIFSIFTFFYYFCYVSIKVNVIKIYAYKVTFNYNRHINSRTLNIFVLYSTLNFSCLFYFH